MKYRIRYFYQTREIILISDGKKRITNTTTIEKHNK